MGVVSTKTELRAGYAAMIEAERARTAPLIKNPELLAIYNAKLDALKVSLFPTPRRQKAVVESLIKPLADLYRGNFTEDERALIIESWECLDLTGDLKKTRLARADRLQREYLTNLETDRFFKT